MVKAEPKNGVTRFDESEIHRHVCACTGVWLHVGVICTKQLLHTVNCNCFNFVDNCVASVITLARVTLCVLVGEHRSGCFHHIWRREVFACNQLQTSNLSLILFINKSKNFCVSLSL